MGIFSDDSSKLNHSDKKIRELVENAENKTVTIDRLTKLDTSGILSRGINLNSSPFIDHIRDDEQPNFILFDQSWNYCITDKSFVIIINNSSDDSSFRIPLESIDHYYTRTGTFGHKIIIKIDDSDTAAEISQYFDFDQSDTNERQEIVLKIANYFDADTIHELDEYLSSQIKIQRNFRGEEDIIEEGYISYYSYDDNKYYKGKSGHIGLSGSTIKLASNYDSHEIMIEDIVELNNHQSIRIKRYSDRGSVDSEKDFEKENGLEIVSKDGDTLLYSLRKRDEYRDIPEEVSAHIKERYNSTDNESTQLVHTLIKPFGNDGTLKVEGWTEGNSLIQASVDADSKTRGKSRGAEAGPFTRSRISSKSSIKGEVSGEISDNKYSSDIICLRVYEESILVDSDIKIDLHYSEIDNIYEQEDGVIIEVGSTTFRIDDVSASDQIGQAVSFIKEQIGALTEQETNPDDEGTPADSAGKLRQLKQLYEDDVLTDSEFQSKKEELLNDF